MDSKAHHRAALEGSLPPGHREKLAAFILAVGALDPPVRLDPVALSAAVQAAANAWAHSLERERAVLGFIALTACTEYPEGVLDMCERLTQEWAEEDDHPPVPYTLYLDGPKGVE